MSWYFNSIIFAWVQSREAIYFGLTVKIHQSCIDMFHNHGLYILAVVLLIKMFYAVLGECFKSCPSDSPKVPCNFFEMDDPKCANEDQIIVIHMCTFKQAVGFPIVSFSYVVIIKFPIQGYPEIIKCWVKLLSHSKILTAPSLKFGINSFI